MNKNNYIIYKNINDDRINLIFFKFLFISYFIFYLTINNKQFEFQQDELTLVSAYYPIKSKHSFSDYLKWISNIVLLNKSFIFFSNKNFMHILKDLRPKELYYKTVFIELEIEDFFTYKYFFKEFNESFKIDIENRIHNVNLYLIWAEKSMFLKKAIKSNFFLRAIILNQNVFIGLMQVISKKVKMICKNILIIGLPLKNVKKIKDF